MHIEKSMLHNEENNKVIITRPNVFLFNVNEKIFFCGKRSFVRLFIGIAMSENKFSSIEQTTANQNKFIVFLSNLVCFLCKWVESRVHFVYFLSEDSQFFHAEHFFFDI